MLFAASTGLLLKSLLIITSDKCFDQIRRQLPNTANAQKILDVV
jgi:hypothetical protein